MSTDFQFTPAGQRVLAAATRWQGATETDELGSIALLLGLLDEPEYRAAGLLALRGIDEEAVRKRWPTIKRVADEHVGSRLPRLSPEVRHTLLEVLARLDESRNFPLATEHLLLGLTLGDDEVAAWLTDRQITSEDLLSDICRRYGINRAPLDVPLDDVPIALAETVSADSRIVYEEEADNATKPSRADTKPGECVASVADVSTAGKFAVVRILDAAANRAGEALRVVEDYVRFALDDAFLTRLCKELRHELTAALTVLPLHERLAARDTPHDVGTTLSTPAEMRRGGLADVAAANLRRLQESLRSLEEYSKLVDTASAARCEQLRYRAYSLQQAVASVARNSARFAAARLYVLVDGRESEAAFAALIGQLIKAGVDVIQLRDKRLDDRTLLARAKRLRQSTRGTQTSFIMNDRADLAVAAEADGVHVGQDELPVREARRIVGAERLVGVSTHSIQQARDAVLEGADYIGVGPTFPSGTKQFAEFPGLDLVRAVAAEIKLPAFAIGGITAENVGLVREAGLSRVAVCGAIVDAVAPAEAVQAIRRRLD